MNGRQKRSSGGYDLRRKVAKKRWDEDFEYYFSKIAIPVEPSLHGSEIEDEKTGNENDDDLGDGAEELCAADESRNSILQGKRLRGRARKVEVLDLDMNVMVSDVSVAETAFREEIIGCSKEFSHCSNTEAAMCKDQVILPLTAVESVAEDNGQKHLKLDAILSSEQISCLQEEEVTSVPEIEKENLLEDDTHIESDHETMVVQMTGETGDLEDIDEIEKRLVSQKVKRRYRRNQLNEDTVQKLSHLSSDDKIECDECHKLLKPTSFRQHLRTHSGIKPYGCDMCDARFTRKGDVERHVRIVHNKQKPYKCCKCHRCFGDKKNLRWHLMNHDKKLFYVCEVCGFKFGKREYWQNHVRIIHPTYADQKPERCITGSEVGANENVRLHTLSGTLLAENESSVDDPVEQNFCTESAENAYSQDQKVVIESDRFAAVAKNNSTNDKKPTQFRNIAPGVTSISSAKDRGSFIPNEHLTETDVMGTVVIQLDGNGINSHTLEPTKTLQVESINGQNVLHINTSDVLEFVQDDSVGQRETYVVNEQSCEVNKKEKLVDSAGEEGIRSIEYMEDGCIAGSRVYGIMLTENLEKGSSVQNFVDALLAALGKGGRKQEAVEAS